MIEIPPEVIKNAAQGDLGAFEMIYQEYFSFVTNVSYRVVNSAEDTEEVTQDVFMTIFNNLKNFRYESSLKTWIYRITINSAINHSKRSAKFRNKHVELTDALHVPAPSTQEPSLTSEKENLLQKFLELLSPAQRTCLVLRSQQGLSYQQISEILKIPINTVRSRIKRARETMLKLRKEAENHEM